MQIMDRFIGENAPVFIIAEAGVNHNGKTQSKQPIDSVLAELLIQTGIA